MNAELDKQLCEKYPKIFVNRNKPMNETAMCWGFSHEDGWYDIIDTTCDALTNMYTTGIIVDKERGELMGLADPDRLGDGTCYLSVASPQVIATQVKEKFGTLRFYYHVEYEENFRELAYGNSALPAATKIAESYHSYIEGIIHMAEILSGRTCEVTGKPGELHVGRGWYKTLNREYAQSDHDRNWIAYADLPTEDSSQ